MNDQIRQAARAVLRSSAVWTGFLLLSVYLLTNGGQTFSSDGEIMFQTAMRIADAHTLTLQPERAYLFPQVVQGQGGFYFSRYGLGQPLAAVPFYMLGSSVLGPLLVVGSTPPHLEMGHFTALLLPIVATAVSAAVLCAWSQRLYRQAWIGVAVGLLYGLATLAWPYTRFFFSEPLFTCCLVIAAFAIYLRSFGFAGLALGYAIATRLGGVMLLPAFLLYIWFVQAHGSAWWQLTRPRLVAMLGWSLGLIPGFLIILANNWARFRTLYEQGYDDQGFTGHIIEGLWGLLFSPGKSVFLYAPLLLLLPVALVLFSRRFRAETALIVLISVTTLLQSAAWWIWWGGWGWGPRFLVPLMPFLMLPFGVLFERSFWRMVLLFVFVPISIGINLLGILVDFNEHLALVTQGKFEREVVYLYDWTQSPIVGHLQLLDFSDLPIVSFVLSRPDIGFPEPVATLLSVSFVVLLIISLIGLWWSLQQQQQQQQACIHVVEQAGG
ncbi:MAG: hypothetical protein HC837_07785 [Chloroflexaceae bacterium]|nr:hypothetical protein [Chloroflexaceae bacterium]